MWSQVQADLEKLLAEKIYSTLLEDSVYRAFLVSAGAKLSELGDYSVPSALRKNFLTEAKIRAYIIVSEIEKTQAIKEDTAGTKLYRGPLELYRLWDSGAPERRTSVWWFEREVIDVCKRSTPRSADARKQWLRDHLAVSRDWSKMDRIDYISLSANSDVPAIVGAGNPVKVYSPDAVSTKASSGSAKPLPMAKASRKDYWDNFGKSFPGGVRQTILPFIPRAQGMDLNAFLNKG
jgi:hypothetical protein